jgi:hypothetical protein
MDFKMERVRIYKDIEVTYREVEKALLTLGFKNESDAERFYFMHKKHKAVYIMPQKAPSEKVLKAHFAANSYGLWASGVIADIHDFAKIIEASRAVATE